ncbi:copper chaperone PCu(A)C [Microbulbifer magnicolonia]|uniref:copper chaperone PCu(A)C n=1 Tax=Microbulbifer magnicolonia TaxID=3109744 RepID=UPI002B413433|nr:copper chaperone PCu(A)C [Microbulbifer sp. GG15]
MKKLLTGFGVLLLGGALAGTGIAGVEGSENRARVARENAGDRDTAVARLQFEGYARETLPGGAVSAAYLSLRNTGDSELRLQRVELPGREDAAADLHATVSEGGINRMRPLAELAIPGGQEVVMAPGGVHLMLHGVQLRAGEQLPLRLRFASGLVLDVAVPVVPLKAVSEDQHHHHHG